LHLHHLTPLNAAAARVAPDVPVVGHLHGTELLLLETIEQGPPAHWVYAGAWAQRMRRWAAACRRLVVPSATQLTRAQALLGIDPARCVQLAHAGGQVGLRLRDTAGSASRLIWGGLRGIAHEASSSPSGLISDPFQRFCVLSSSLRIAWAIPLKSVEQ
jgi:hypothetical protein